MIEQKSLNLITSLATDLILAYYNNKKEENSDLCVRKLSFILVDKNDMEKGVPKEYKAEVEGTNLRVSNVDYQDYVLAEPQTGEENVSKDTN